MKSKKIRKLFLDFFQVRGHKVVPSSSLIPDDPSVLLTTAGMQQFKPYFTGEADPVSVFGSKNTASIQKSFRTSDIDEVGDESHLTFFEMLGNFSFGGYFKKEAITYAFDFITKEIKLPISYVTIFQGSDIVPKDEESRKIWNSLGVTDVREESMEEVFWGPTGHSGPCGPTTEIFCKNVNGQDVEVWNIVFNQYFFPGSREELLSGTSGKKLQPLKTFGVDTGMGFERLVMMAQNVPTIFETDLFAPIIFEVRKAAKESPDPQTERIIADHVRAAAFMIADGIEPSNTGRGYILRRLLRRAILRQKLSKLEIYNLNHFIPTIIEVYKDFYPSLAKNEKYINEIMRQEGGKFIQTIHNGDKILTMLFIKARDKKRLISGRDLFEVFSTYGFPIELSFESLDISNSNNILGEGLYDKEKIVNEFNVEFKKHQEISRAGMEKKFGGHGLILDTGELKAGSEEELKKVMRLHTATHLLQQALRDVLGDSVEQRGSDVSAERTRFDFSFERKVTPEELKKVEDIVNQKIKEDMPVNFKEMSKEEAEKTGALHFFKAKYPDRVKVYYIGKSLGDAYSKEFCGGPHVTHTGEIGKFKIAKEESVAAGIRRIRATVE